MDLSCSKCNSKYRINDEKIKDKKIVKIRCRKCGDIIEKDNNLEFEFSQINSISNDFNFDDMKTEIKAPPQLKKTPPQLNKNPQLNKEETSNLNRVNSFELTREVYLPDLEKTKLKKNPMKAKNSIKNSLETNPSFKKNSLYQTKNIKKVAPKKQVQEFKTSAKKSTNVILVFISSFIIIISILFSLAFALILYRNDWSLDINNLEKMIKVAISGKDKKVQKEIPIKKQISILNVKTDIYFNKKYKKNILVVSGELKNISNTSKSLISLEAVVTNKKDNKEIFSKTVYAGNYFSKKDILKFKTEEELDTEYLQSGKNGVNWNLKFNSKIPYMIVFFSKDIMEIEKLNISIKINSFEKSDN